MQFQLSEEHYAFRDMAAEFARDKLLPYADNWDEQAYFPKETLREAAELGMAAHN